MDSEEKVDRLYLDMYFGEGKENPSIITRLDRVEQWMESMTTNSNQIKWALYGAIILMLVNMVVTHIKF